ncbi:MAG: pentapeptide repeat-containing protein [Cyanobacteria bacterium J06638_20]
MANSLWRFLNTPIHKLVSLDTVDGAVDTVKAIDTLAEALEDEQVQEIAPWVEKGAALLDVLNTPEAELAESLLPFTKIATGLLKFYLKKSQAQLTFADCVVLVSLKAYGESLKGFLPATVPRANDTQKKKEDGQTQIDAPSSLQEFTLSDSDAKTALLCFRKSELAEHLKILMAERLKAAGFAEADAQRLTERAAWNTHRYITEAWGELPEASQRFGSTTLADWREEQEKYAALDNYLRDRIEPLPSGQVFDETNPRIVYQDLYILLDVQPLDQNGIILKDQRPINIHTWASNILLNSSEQNLPRRVMFLQGEAGRGKSLFSRMFADWVRRELCPVFVPIVVRLRSLRVLANNFTETLEDCPDLETVGFVRRDRGWLTDENVRFLIVLDGFDELLLEDRPTGGLKEFLQQIADFQARSHHQCLVTGRPLALQGIDRLITQTKNLERVQLQLMRDELRQQWLAKWQRIFGEAEVNRFQSFIEACPKEIADHLAREPLLLYLLARLHREGHLHQELFSAGNSPNQTIQAKIRVYREAVNWVLKKQRQDENLRLAGLNDLEDLREVLQEAALCVVQSGNETAQLTFLKRRFQDSANPIAQLLQQAKQSTGQTEDKALNNLLTTFYLRPSEGDRQGAVEFAHKSFGEYLFAERILEAFSVWTEMDRKGRQFQCSDREFCWQVYDLLGFGGLSIEIVEAVFALLQDSEIDRSKLFQRFHNFYWRWCEAEFVNQSQDKNFPQQKMLQLQLLDIDIGLQQVDVYTGLNVLIFLFKLHTFVQHPDYPRLPENAPSVIINFHPCGNLNSALFDRDRLLKIIHYAESLGSGTFTKIVGPHLASANLARVNLAGTNLAEANFARANLTRASLTRANLASTNLASAYLNRASLDIACLDSTNLYKADLYKANLNRANLYRANLDSANLDRAKLCSTNLTSVHLDSANLASADLDKANLTSANLTNANLTNANLDRADLSNAYLASTNLTSANLTSTNLTSAYLYRANLTSANLDRANLTSANLDRANLINVNLASANLDNAYLYRADLTSANLDSANLDSTNLDSANLENTNLTSASLAIANLYSTNLYNANLYSANLASSYFESANLASASLENANLDSANLDSANLESTNLDGANLTSTNFTSTNLSAISWNSSTAWKNVEGLATARNVPTELKQQLGLEE